MVSYGNLLSTDPLIFLRPVFISVFERRDVGYLFNVLLRQIVIQCKRLSETKHEGDNAALTVARVEQRLST
jgi:hypothetical protein